jgi:hypothetical protein
VAPLLLNISLAKLRRFLAFVTARKFSVTSTILGSGSESLGSRLRRLAGFLGDPFSSILARRWQEGRPQEAKGELSILELRCKWEI